MYLFYVDDSGSRDPSVADGRDPIYSLTAIGMWEGHWREFDAELFTRKRELVKALKSAGKVTELKNIDDTEVKSSLLRNPRNRAKESAFLDALSDDDRTALANLYYAQLTKRKAYAMSVVIDKRELHDDGRKRVHHIAYDILLRQIEAFLDRRHRSHNGIIVMDDTSPQLNEEVARMHYNILHGFSPSKHKMRRVMEYPFFSDSSFSHGLQLADLCAYNVYRAFRREQFDYPQFTAMRAHFVSALHDADEWEKCIQVIPPTSPLAQTFHAFIAAEKAKFAPNGTDLR